MAEYSAADLARMCRHQARLTTNKETITVLLRMADRYDAEHDQAVHKSKAGDQAAAPR